MVRNVSDQFCSRDTPIVEYNLQQERRRKPLYKVKPGDRIRAVNAAETYDEMIRELRTASEHESSLNIEFERELSDTLELCRTPGASKTPNGSKTPSGPRTLFAPKTPASLSSATTSKRATPQASIECSPQDFKLETVEEEPDPIEMNLDIRFSRADMIKKGRSTVSFSEVSTREPTPDDFALLPGAVGP